MHKKLYMAFGYGDFIFLVLVVVFLGFKFFSILGRRESDDDIERFKQFGARGKNNSTAQENRDFTSKAKFQTPEKQMKIAEEVEVIDPLKNINFADEQVKEDFKVIMKRDLSFDPQNFIDGAKAAFEMVLKAYCEKDRETLKYLLDKEIYDEFSERIAKDEQNKITHNINLVSVDIEEVQSAKLNTNVAKIGLKIQSEQINFAKNSDDEIIEGNTNDIDIVDDEWVFERNIKSSNPNWLITSL